MEEKQIVISFQEYKDISEMPQEDQELCTAAIEAMSKAYAPYSHFHVGAAVRLIDGKIVKGSNQENAAYPSGLCAERTAMFSAGASYPDIPMVSIAVVGGEGGVIARSPATPCGACRQVMAQYQTRGGHDMSVILIGADVILKFKKVDDILPLIFDSI